MVTDIPEKVKTTDNGLFTRKTMEEILPKPTRDNDLFIDDIFRHQKVNLGNCRRWSRHLVHAVPTAPATSSQRTEINPTGLSNVMNHVCQLDSGEAEREISVEESYERGLEEKWLPKMDEGKPAGHPENTQDKKLEDFDNPSDLTEENVQQEDKSVRRRMLNWVNGLVQEHYREKIGKTYRRELEEGDRIYSRHANFFIRPTTRAEREQQKRAKYLHRDNKRRTIKGRLDAFWEEKREKEEALREEEEERFEKWAAEHGAGVSNATPGEPKKRMSARKKGFLRAKEFFVH